MMLVAQAFVMTILLLGGFHDGESSIVITSILVMNYVLTLIYRNSNTTKAKSEILLAIIELYQGKKIDFKEKEAMNDEYEISDLKISLLIAYSALLVVVDLLSNVVTFIKSF